MVAQRVPPMCRYFWVFWASREAQKARNGTPRGKHMIGCRHRRTDGRHGNHDNYLHIGGTCWVRMYKYRFMYMYVCMYACMYVCMYICMYT